MNAVPSPPPTPATKPPETVAARFEDSPPAQRGSTWASFFISLVLHISLLLILAATYRAWQKPPPTLAIETTFSPGEKEETIASPLPEDDMAMPLDEVVFSDAAPPSAEELAKSDDEADWPGLAGIGGTNGIGGDGAGGGVGFFGTTARGRSFVFVVDCSGSMQGARFRRAVEELQKSVKQLQPDQKFQVLFFNQQALPLVHSKYGEQLMPANRAVVPEVLRWIADRRAGGGTVPDEALVRALRLKPDVVFFLTDAERVPRTVRTLITQHNKSRTIVHTIAFGQRGGETLMQGIAADHRGRYRFVP